MHATQDADPVISLVIPTYNEKGNVDALVQGIACAMRDVAWEAIFVDDDSPDETYREVQRLTTTGLPVHCIRRIGRRGLTSAVMEGFVRARAPVIGVMDADLQHDPMLLPEMCALLQSTHADIVIASRYLQGGGLGEWSWKRRMLSRGATRLSRVVVGREISDPMSGFFLIRRSVMEQVMYDVSGLGFKVLLDILTSSPAPLKLVEVPYTFGQRNAGESKAGAKVAVEYLVFLFHRITRGLVPAGLLLPFLVGTVGVLLYLPGLAWASAYGLPFPRAQLVATLLSINSVYLLARLTTHRSGSGNESRRLGDCIQYCASVAAGVLTCLGVGELLFSHLGLWFLGGAAASLLGNLVTFSLAHSLVWSRKLPGVRHSGATAS